MRTWTAMLVLSAACASRQEPPPRERVPIDVWIPDATSEADKEAIAKALVGHPQPRHDRLPPHHCVRRVEVLYDDDTTWEFLIELAMTHARQLDADAVVVGQQDWAQSSEFEVLSPTRVIRIVRYHADGSGEANAR